MVSFTEIDLCLRIRRFLRFITLEDERRRINENLLVAHLDMYAGTTPLVVKLCELQ
jgi:hypothetical protein